MVADKDLRQAAALIEEGKGYYLDLINERRAIDTLQAHLVIKDKIIERYQNIDRTNQQIVFNKDQQLGIKDNLLLGKDASIASLNKSLRKEKRKKWVWAVIAGGAVYGLSRFNIF